MLRTFFKIFFIIFSVSLLLSSFFYIMHPKQFSELEQKKKEYENLRKINEEILKENEFLEFQIKLLQTNLSYIEKIAREELGMIKEGEIVLKIQP